MDMAMLEGYLAALLVWPLSLSSGAWLPPIWGEKAGWKVPAKIAAPEAFHKFIGLVVGLLRELDRGLDVPQFVPTLSTDEPVRRGPRSPGISWAQGFLCALQQSAQGLQGRSPAARSAVEGIAAYASLAVPSRGAQSVVVTNLTAAVLALAAERSSRGPLGALETKLPKAVKNRSPVMSSASGSDTDVVVDRPRE
jgi:yecA family protein